MLGVINTALGPEVDASDDYALMTGTVLPRLGFGSDQIKPGAPGGVPSLEQICLEGLNNDLGAWLIHLIQQEGNHGRLLIAPRVGGEEGAGVASLIKRYIPHAYADPHPAVWSPLWGDKDGKHNPYADSGKIHDNPRGGTFTGWDVAVLLEDVTDPVDGQPTLDPGLVYTGKTVQEQREALVAERQFLQRLFGVNIMAATVGHMVVDSLARRESGLPGRTGVTRLLHYPGVSVDGRTADFNVDASNGRFIPDVSATGPEGHSLQFGDSYMDARYPGRGIRRAVRVALSG